MVTATGMRRELSPLRRCNAFLDPRRVIRTNLGYSGEELRFFCIGRIGARVTTVRFTWWDGRIRIIGAGWWREGGKIHRQAKG